MLFLTAPNRAIDRESLAVDVAQLQPGEFAGAQASLSRKPVENVLLTSRPRDHSRNVRHGEESRLLLLPAWQFRFWQKRVHILLSQRRVPDQAHGAPEIADGLCAKSVSRT